MPAPPPVPAVERYPQAIRDFVTYMDQPQDGTKVFVAADGSSTDLTLDAAAVTRDLQTEIVSLEQTIGAPPFLVPKTTSLGSSIQWLFNYKSSARPAHDHLHRQTTARDADDHPQYMRVDGRRAFTAPVTSPAARASNELINLSQAKGAGLNSAQVRQIIVDHLAAQKLVPGEANITGPDSRRWKMAGGVAEGYTDGNGNLWVDLTPARFVGIACFHWMKMPFGGMSMLGWYNYQYMEDQLVLLGLSTQGALIQFIEDIRVDRRAQVRMCWMALGI